MTTPISPKVIAATVAALGIPGIIAMLGYLQTNEGQTLFAALPPILVIGINAIIPALVVFVSGYLVKDALRDKGAESEDEEIPDAEAPAPRRALIEPVVEDDQPTTDIEGR